MELSEHAVHIGAAVSLSQTKEYLAQVVNKLPGTHGQGCCIHERTV